MRRRQRAARRHVTLRHTAARCLRVIGARCGGAPTSYVEATQVIDCAADTSLEQAPVRQAPAENGAEASCVCEDLTIVGDRSSRTSRCQDLPAGGAEVQIGRRRDRRSLLSALRWEEDRIAATVASRSTSAPR